MQDDSPLVDVHWLASRLHQEDLVVLDGSFFLPGQGIDPESAFVSAHIPGSLFFDIDQIADQASSLPHMLPSAEVFALAVQQMGIGPDTEVVVYDQNVFMASARVWWMFRCFGHERVRVLDGGLARWQQCGLPVVAGQVPPPVQATGPVFSAGQPGSDLVWDLAMIRQWVAAGGQVVDARSPGRFLGQEPEPRPGVRSGSMPGSFNVHFRTLVRDDTHEMLPCEHVLALFASAGVDVARPLVASCGTGVTACTLALALYRCGFRQVPVYDGSWSEWGGLKDTPVVSAA